MAASVAALPLVVQPGAMQNGVVPVAGGPIAPVTMVAVNGPRLPLVEVVVRTTLAHPTGNDLPRKAMTGWEGSSLHSRGIAVCAPPNPAPVTMRVSPLARPLHDTGVAQVPPPGDEAMAREMFGGTDAPASGPAPSESVITPASTDTMPHTASPTVVRPDRQNPEPVTVFPRGVDVGCTTAAIRGESSELTSRT